VPAAAQSAPAAARGSRRSPRADHCPPPSMAPRIASPQREDRLGALRVGDNRHEQIDPASQGSSSLRQLAGGRSSRPPAHFSSLARCQHRHQLAVTRSGGGARPAGARRRHGGPRSARGPGRHGRRMDGGLDLRDHARLTQSRPGGCLRRPA
jgi:hypothetical protein